MRRLAEHELVAITLSFFPGSLFANGRQPLQQSRNLRLVAGFPQRLNKAIQRRLIVRVDCQCSPALLDGLTILARLELQFRQHAVRGRERRLE